ncbi:unnamed protein product [Euphydryas editha]|uniref:Deoxynucleoside kinase domain-containing protein n=1 Tax=Euphydryas editha TaxID=104508 RepID=A0AAU9TMF2_EUPED|nr:unnamed protein product [Euphydryas editha]
MPSFFIDGVACLTKTTLLQRLENEHPDWAIHYSDYAAFVEKFDLDCGDGQKNSLLYTANRFKWEVDPRQVNIFDRHPVTTIVYSYVFEKVCNMDKMMKHFQVAKAISPPCKGIVLLPKPGQYELVVNQMKKRNSVLDSINLEYVKKQTTIFRVWAQVFEFPVFEVDYLNLDQEQDKIVSVMNDLVMKG